MCGRDDRFFALPISAVFGFKFFSHPALRVKSLPTPGVSYFRSLAPVLHCSEVYRSGGELSYDFTDPGI